MDGILVSVGCLILHGHVSKKEGHRKEENWAECTLAARLTEEQVCDILRVCLILQYPNHQRKLVLGQEMCDYGIFFFFLRCLLISDV